MPEQLDLITTVLRTTECNLVWSNLITNVLRMTECNPVCKENCMYRAWLQAEYIAGALVCIYRINNIKVLPIEC